MPCHLDIYKFKLYCKCNEIYFCCCALQHMYQEIETARALQAFAAVCLLFCFLGGRFYKSTSHQGGNCGYE